MKISKEQNMITKNLLKISMSVLLCFIVFCVADAQTKPSIPTNELKKNQSTETRLDFPEGTISCEMWLLYLGTTIQEWEKNWKLNNDSTLIIVARAGNNESHQTNLKRIKTLKEYILYPKWKIKAVFAEGEPTNGNGVIELYVEGKLFVSLPVDEKRDVPLRLCN